MTEQTAIAACAAMIVTMVLATTTGSAVDPMRVNNPPVPFGLSPLRWGTVRAQGWIRDWAIQAANGAVSPEKAVFAKITVSNKSVDGWQNGRPAIGHFWDEDSAYWIDGMTRLAFVLDNTTLLARVKDDIDYVLSHPYDFHNTWPLDACEGWVRSIYSRGMLAYYDGTGDKRVLDFIVTSYQNYTAHDSVMANSSDQSHQGSRSMTQMEVLLEGHAYGGPDWMVDLALSLMGPKALNQGYNFMNTLLNPGCQALSKGSVIATGCETLAHGVTYNEVAKLFGMGYSWSRNVSHLRASTTAFNLITKFDLQPYGVNSAYEDLNGISPTAGTETCDVSDHIYSNAWMLRVTGDGRYGDRLEKAFINAAPGAVNRTFLGHVYFQTPNLSPKDRSGSVREEKLTMMWWHAPPCCTGNQARMLPNFIHHMWMGTQDNGLAAAMYGPSSVTVSVGDKQATLEMTMVTNYPFDTTVSMQLDFVNSSDATEFPLLLRIPAWCDTHTGGPDSCMAITVGGSNVGITRDAKLSSFARVYRSWISGDIVTINFSPEIRAEIGKTVNNGWNATIFQPSHELGAGHITVVPDLPFCTVSYGPILFALPLEVNSTFNFAINCNASTMSLERASTMPSPFEWPLDAPVKITVDAIPFNWESTFDLPKDPVTAANATGSPTKLTLIPYGSAKVFHVSMFPVWNP